LLIALKRTRANETGLVAVVLTLAIHRTRPVEVDGQSQQRIPILTRTLRSSSRSITDQKANLDKPG
jgi:hypothetical protein